MTPDEMARLSEKTDQALRDEEYPLAISLADQLIEAYPDNGQFRCWRAWSLICTGSAAQALQDAQIAVRSIPDSYEAHLCLAMAAGILEKNQLAQSSFERAVALSNRDPDVLGRFAMWMCLMRAPTAAEEIALEALKASPEEPQCWAVLGKLRLRQHRHGEAESCLKRALELDPNCHLAQAWMIDLLMATGRHDEAGALATVAQDAPALEEFANTASSAVKESRIVQELLSRDDVVDEIFRRQRPSRWPIWLPCVIMALPIVTVFLAGFWKLGAILTATVILHGVVWWLLNR